MVKVIHIMQKQFEMLYNCEEIIKESELIDVINGG